MAGFGYTKPTTGFKAPKQTGMRYSPVASALSGYSPLSGATNATRSPYAAAPAPDPSGGAAPAPAPTHPPIHPPVSEAPLAPTPQPYDINTDPILQQITSYLGKSDEDAQAAALKQRKDLLLGYGDSSLINALLPGETDLASAAASNPTSTLAGLRTQRERNTHSLTDALNKDNLFYSGARITQEQQAAQDYLGALAQAAGAVQGGLGTIDSNLAGALGANQLTRAQQMGSAYDRHKGETTTAAPGATIVATPQTPAVPTPGVDTNTPTLSPGFVDPTPPSGNTAALPAWMVPGQETAGGNFFGQDQKGTKKTALSLAQLLGYTR